MITLRGCEKSFGDGKRRLRADFSIGSDERIALLGANGSGKSTLLDIIARVVAPDVGELDAPATPVGYAVQDSSSGLLPWLSVGANIRLPSILVGGETLQPGQIETALTRFGLATRMRAFPYQLSGGEKQIVNLVRALFTPCQLLLLDEPFAPLNYENRDRAKEAITETLEKRGAILVTHNVEDLAFSFTRFLMIRSGTVCDISELEAKAFLSNGQ